MNNQDIIDYIHTSICNCHTADEYVGMAQQVLPHISQEFPEFRNFYNFLCGRIIMVTPIEDQHIHLLDQAIKTY